MSSMNVEVVSASFVSPNFAGASSAWKELRPHRENLLIVKLSHMNQSQYMLFMVLSIKMYIS
jgi:hypothetical protein